MKAKGLQMSETCKMDCRNQTCRKVNFTHNRVVCTSHISKPSEPVQPYLGSDSDLISATDHVCYTKLGDLKIASNKIALFLEVLQNTYVILLRELC